MTVPSPPVPRRSFLSRLGVGFAALGAAFGPGADAAAQTPSVAPPPAWQPTRHPQDDWLDRVPGQHRLVFDTTMPEGLGGAMFYASNFYAANQNGYGLANADAAVVIVLRHNSTPFAYNDAMWAKYGKAIPPMAGLDDPKTKQRPTINIYAATGYADLPNLGTTIPAVLQRGVHFAVCQMATQFFAGMLAQATGGTADAVFKELTANLVGNSHMAAAGIVAVNRAQERSYTLATPI